MSGYTVAQAAERLGLKQNQIRGMVKNLALKRVQAGGLPRSEKAGRSPSIFISKTQVDKLRAEKIARLGAVESSSSVSTDDYRALQEECAALRGNLATLQDQLRLSIVSQQAQLDQLRLFMAPEGLH